MASVKIFSLVVKVNLELDKARETQLSASRHWPSQ
jgi:hypothetical protein